MCFLYRQINSLSIRSRSTRLIVATILPGSISVSIEETSVAGEIQSRAKFGGSCYFIEIELDFGKCGKSDEGDAGAVLASRIQVEIRQDINQGIADSFEITVWHLGTDVGNHHDIHPGIG